jgi:outer membrane protein OmpA-like peptidoglycan-associated protein
MVKQSSLIIAVAAVVMVTGGTAFAQGAARSNGQFMVFFDWGKPDLSRDAETILDQVIAAYKANPSARLQLLGHSDRSGRAVANRLSALNRAKQVREYLAGKGIPARSMTVASAGEDRPLVLTEDGVREVQNRRVEIQFGN